MPSFRPWGPDFDPGQALGDLTQALEGLTQASGDLSLPEPGKGLLGPLPRLLELSSGLAG